MCSSMMNGYGKVQCKPSIGSSQMYSNKKKPKHYYEKDSKWKEATWTPTFQNSSRPYDTQDSTTTTLWSSTSLPMDYWSRCMKTSTLTSNPAHTSSGGKRPFSNRRPLYISERDSIVGAPHPHRPQGRYSTINGGELLEILTPWTPLKDVSGHD